jgi:hypothetical protein
MAAMNDPAPAGREARWPAGLAIVCVALVMALVPERVRLLPFWINGLVAVGVLSPILLAQIDGRWERVERITTLAFAAFAGVGTLRGLGTLLRDVVGRTQPLGGLALLSSSVALWGLNVLTFSLLYWQLDRGGPSAREDGAARRPDWSFPQDEASAEAVDPRWTPTYPDYLFLAYSTATAFSATDALPLTTRAKMLMMVESLISLTTLALIASRAINILGT